MPSAAAIPSPCVRRHASNRVTRCLDSVAALALFVWTLPILILAALVIGPFNASVPAWAYQCAWLFGAFAVFALVCNYESGSEG